jgi:predicted urease superfamily metal-dependent hydrolase
VAAAQREASALAQQLDSAIAIHASAEREGYISELEDLLIEHGLAPYRPSP